jgi:hypothetical protein
MSHNPAADELGSAGRENVAHDRGSMHADAEGTQGATGALGVKAPNDGIKLETQEAQGQSAPSNLLAQRSSLAPEASRDEAAVATSELQDGVTAQAHDSTPIHAGKLKLTAESEYIYLIGMPAACFWRDTMATNIH